MRQRRVSKEAQIRTLALFRDCSAQDVHDVARLGDMVDLPAGQTLAVAGCRSHDLVVVVDGVAVGSCPSGEIVLLPGSSYGGFYGGPHALAVESLTPVRVIVFPQRTLHALIERVPSIAAAAAVWKPFAAPRRAARPRPCRRRPVRTGAAHPAV